MHHTSNLEPLPRTYYKDDPKTCDAYLVPYFYYITSLLELIALMLGLFRIELELITEEHMEFQELLKVDEADALKFFYRGLIGPATTKKIHGDQTIHVASVLASYSQSSFSETSSLPPPVDLSSVFDLFVVRHSELADPDLLIVAGAQTLFMAGFFRDQMSRRHNLAWYDKIGSTFYHRASLVTETPKRRALLEHMAQHFTVWAQICRDLHLKCRENRYPIIGN